MKALKSLLVLAAASGFLTCGAMAATTSAIDVPAGAYVSDKLHTNILWSVSHFGLSHYIGRFDDISATLDFDPKNVVKSKLTVVINPASVDTNYPSKDKDFNAEVAGKTFLDAPEFKEIKFVSTAILLKDEKSGTVTGNLTFHGVTKPVVLDVTFNGALNPHPITKKATIGFSAAGVIKRSDFGVASFVGPISDEVKLTIESEFVPQ